MVTTSIALLRGVNVGGNRKVPMAELRALFVDAGFENVTTYIQSGNVVFAHRKRSPDALEADLEARIQAAVGFDVSVVVRTAHQWDGVVRNNPFPGVEPTKLHVAFLKSDPAPDWADAIDVAAFAPEELVLVGRDLYLHLPNGMGRAKLPPTLRALRTPTTARSWQTVMKLQELASG